jgi:hypothetical protein
MRFEHGWDIRTDESHLVALADAVLPQRAGQAIGSPGKFPVTIPFFAMDNCCLVGIDESASGQEFDWRQNALVYMGRLHQISPFTTKGGIANQLWQCSHLWNRKSNALINSADPIDCHLFNPDLLSTKNIIFMLSHLFIILKLYNFIMGYHLL